MAYVMENSRELYIKENDHRSQDLDLNSAYKYVVALSLSGSLIFLFSCPSSALFRNIFEQSFLS